MAFDQPRNSIVLDFRDDAREPPTDDLSVVVHDGDCLWVASDETTTIERLRRLEDGVYGEHCTFDLKEIFDLPEQDPAEAEIDIEGMAIADDYLWITGSHSLKRSKPRKKDTDEEAMAALADIQCDANRYLLGCIPIARDDSGRPALVRRDGDRQAACLKMKSGGNRLTKDLKNDPQLHRFLEIPAKENGFDIEGLAVHGNRLFLGLRGPVLRGWAVIIDFEVMQETGTLKLRKAGPNGLRYRKRFFELDGLGIRELAIRGRDLLILAGPTMDLDGPVSVHVWQDGAISDQDGLIRKDRLPVILSVPYGNGVDHAEGITMYSTGEASDMLLIVYDSPADDRKPAEHQVRADLFRPHWGP